MHPNQMNDGFVDAHVHMTGIEGISDILSAGISAIRNAGMKANRERFMESNSLQRNKPALVSSLWALYKPGGYGAPFGAVLHTRKEIKSEIAKLKAAGADIIKVMASGIVSLDVPGTVTAGGFDRSELCFIAEEAGKLGLGVMCHANSEPAIIAAIDAGVRSIEHGFFMTRHTLELMAKREIYWTPTVGALVRAAERQGKSGIFVSEIVRAHLQMMGHAFAAGVPLAVGTDCVLPDPHYRAAYESELSYLEQAGIPHDAVLTIASQNGARLLGLIK